MTTTSESRTGGAGRVFALLVGIDDYLPPVPALFGCRNDVRHLGEYLTGRLGDRLRLATLLDRAATRQGVIDAFRTHLGQAGPGDVALFAYSGHGSEEPAPPEVAAFEATGRIQTLVCADSGRRVGGVLVRGLADKELAVLISEVAARGAHVSVVLDCCHSGNGTRDAAVRVRQWVPDPGRVAPEHSGDVAELAAGRPAGDLLPGAAAPRRLDHVALSACQSFQVAKESTFGGEARGAFSVALLDALTAIGPGTTYRALLAAVRSRVERTTAEQNPVCFPVDAGGPADAVVFDGSVQRTDPTFHVTKALRGWEVDAGSIHGLTAPVDERPRGGSAAAGRAEGEAFELACSEPGSSAIAGTVRVTEVGVSRSLVEPIGWEPADIAYDAVIAGVPLPMAVVRFDEPTDARAREVCDRLAAAIASAGPGGVASPYVRVAPEPAAGDATVDATVDAGSGALLLRVAAHPAGYEVTGVEGADVLRVRAPCVRVLRADGTPFVADVSGVDDAAVRAVVDRLEHVARWEQLRLLGGHPSRLRDAIRLEVVGAEPGELGAPGDRRPLVPSPGYELVYRRAGSAWVAPEMYLRLVNTSAADLYVAVLDLTDRFRCHAALYPTSRIAAGHTVAVFDGARIDGSLPAGRPVVSGATARDWIKVIVSETDFDACAFEMTALDEPFVASRGVVGTGSTLERLAARVLTRDLGARPPAGSTRPEWCAETYEVTIRVP